MEEKQKQYLNKFFRETIRARKLKLLGIPGRYCYMQPELMEELKHKVKLF
ncbi:hypothetical protein [Adhaeribacter aquaticus]|nr:hypothetical protein [Adhaeribacter aquaticus]